MTGASGAVETTRTGCQDNAERQQGEPGEPSSDDRQAEHALWVRQGLTGWIGVLPGGGSVATGTWSPHLDALGTVASRPLGSNRPDERERASRRPRGWLGRINHEVLAEK